MKKAINFLEDEFHYLSPFSAHQITIWGEIFPTAEHAYQAARIIPGNERDEIKNAKSPKDAWRLGQRFKKTHQTKDFNKDEIMEEIFRAKLEQHNDIKEILLRTENAILQKIIAEDSYWGTGPNGDGLNMMGKLWMKLRSELTSTSSQ